MGGHGNLVRGMEGTQVVSATRSRTNTVVRPRETFGRRQAYLFKRIRGFSADVGSGNVAKTDFILARSLFSDQTKYYWYGKALGPVSLGMKTPFPK
jgi:hypothetical protein